MVTTTTPGGQRVSICTCTRTGRQLATFTRRPGSSLYTLTTKPPQVAASGQVSASGPVAAPYSCHLLSHQTLLWHHRLGHPSLPRLRGMHSRLLLSVRLQLRERIREDLPVLRLHSDRGGEFSSDLLRDFCRGEGILQSFTLPASPQQNGVAERRIGLVMEVARSSMILAASPHFLWPFAVWYAAHQLNLWPRVSLPETSPTLRWTGEVGDASVFRTLMLLGMVVSASGGAEPAGAELGGAKPAGAEPGGAEPAGAEPGGAGAGSTGARGTAQRRLFFVPPPPSSLPLPGSVVRQTDSLTERCEPESRPASPICAVCTGRRVPRPRPPPVPGTHIMALRRSSVPLRVPLPSPPTSSLGDSPDPESDLVRAASPTVTRLLATVVTDPLFESAAASALVDELADFAAACRLNYAASLVAESESDSPPSIGGECALSTDVLEDIQEDFECLAAAVPHLVAILVAPEGDPDAPDIPTPRSYIEAITGPDSSQWQTAMDADMASWKSKGTYVDAVPPPRANRVDGMWIFK
ncbi:unnamed protein product, partial [Closterium sp. NIES-54]